MKAEVGDRIAIMSRHLDEAVREGEIVAVHGAEGGPPYVVRWLDSGHVGMLFPGPDAHVVPGPGADVVPGMETGAAVGGANQIRAEQWQVMAAIVEYDDGKTKAHVVAHAGQRTLQAHGEAWRRAGAVEFPQVGAEVAAGRAFIALGEELLERATQDIEDIGGDRQAVGRSPDDATV
jgi:hypothetical protein